MIIYIGLEKCWCVFPICRFFTTPINEYQVTTY